MSMNDGKNGQAEGSVERIASLRELIRSAFPENKFTGKVTPHDGEWLPELTEENAILDDDKFLYEALNGRKWTEVPTEFLYEHPDGFVLLTDEALVAFLPAWLICSLENLAGNNEVRNFVVYSFSPRPDMVPDMTWFSAHQFSILNSQQRLAVRDLLAEFAERESSAFVRALAVKAVTFIDQVE